jgi:hypothetical protein
MNSLDGFHPLALYSTNSSLEYTAIACQDSGSSGLPFINSAYGLEGLNERLIVDMIAFIVA